MSNYIYSSSISIGKIWKQPKCSTTCESRSCSKIQGGSRTDKIFAMNMANLGLSIGTINGTLHNTKIISEHQNRNKP